jgi:hypothetical protein
VIVFGLAALATSIAFVLGLSLGLRMNGAFVRGYQAARSLTFREVASATRKAAGKFEGRVETRQALLGIVDACEILAARAERGEV